MVLCYRAPGASGTWGSASAAVTGFGDLTRRSSLAGWDLMLGSIAAFYAVMVPYTKVEESFNVQVRAWTSPWLNSLDRLACFHLRCM
jgi:hypothetical protein